MTTPTEPTAVGERLRLARMNAGLSQGQVAKILELHRPTISQIESGQRNVRPNEIAQFAQIYGVRESWIVSGESAGTGKATTDPRIELAARELAKLKKDDLDAILRLIKIMRPTREGTDA